MIVVAIIGILAAIAIPNFVKFQARSRQGEAKLGLKAHGIASKSVFARTTKYVCTDCGWAPDGNYRYNYFVGTLGVTASTNGCPEGTSVVAAVQTDPVVGTPGGSTIFTSVFQTIMNIVDFGMTPLEAIDAARFHHQLLPPDMILLGKSRPLPEETLKALGDRGYKMINPFDFGDIQVIYDDGEAVDAASDPRNRGESRVID